MTDLTLDIVTAELGAGTTFLPGLDLLATWLREAGPAVRSAPALALADLVADASERCETCLILLPPWAEVIRGESRSTYCCVEHMSDEDARQRSQDLNDDARFEACRDDR